MLRRIIWPSLGFIISTGLASCGGTNPEPSHGIASAGVSAPSSEAQQPPPPPLPGASSGPVAGTASGAPAPSVVPPSPASSGADPTSFACGSARCVAGKETCCDRMVPSNARGVERRAECIAAPAADPRERDLERIYSVECKVPYTGAGIAYANIDRCDESQDCGAKEVCCRLVNDPLQHPAFAHLCVPAGKSGSPCPGDERCVPDGPGCRTPLATCVDGYCVRPFKDPERVCETAADCLSGQHCLHPDGRRPLCVAEVEFEICEDSAHCQAFCTDKRARCRADPKTPDTKTCECP